MSLMTRQRTSMGGAGEHLTAPPAVIRKIAGTGAGASQRLTQRFDEVVGNPLAP